MPDTSTPPRNHLITVGLVVSTLLTLSPLAGLIGTAVGMIKAFNSISPEGAAGDPGHLSVGVGHALVSTFVGLVLCIPGIVILTISLVYRRRAKWAEIPPQSPS